MIVRSHKHNVYSEREKLIFRALCAYGATAFVNAKAYQQLQDAHIQLVAHGKMVALGSMVAGIAHELNTPIGNCLLAASTLEMETATFEDLNTKNTLRRSDLNSFIDVTKRSLQMVIRGLNTAANLVSSFKQVAADQESEKRSHFFLHELLHKIPGLIGKELKDSGHTLSIDAPNDIHMHSYPEPFTRVLINLIMNSLAHAFDNGSPGQMSLTARRSKNDTVTIIFHDNGIGINELNLKRIFDPFFTTKLGQGYVGLGLNISYNIVTFILKGSISVESHEGKGCTFTLELPIAIIDNK